MNDRTMYQVDYSADNWNQIINELKLPRDTEEISIQVIDYITTREVKKRNLPPVSSK